MTTSKSPFESLVLEFTGLLSNDKKWDPIPVVYDDFGGYVYLFPVSKNIDAIQTAKILQDKIFTVHEYFLPIVFNKNCQFMLYLLQEPIKHLQSKPKMANYYHYQKEDKILHLYNPSMPSPLHQC
jgi:hypothetical protein